MKKITICITIILVLTMFKEISVGQNIIPNEAIRLRVLANSNSKYDQDIKEKVSTELQGVMYPLLAGASNVDEAMNIIKTNLSVFSRNIKDVLNMENYQMEYDINFGDHYFPDKQYKGIQYKAGNYKSLLVQLGEGNGNNWWCVLFPPLCLLEAEEATDVEYKFFVQELIDKFF